MKVLGTIRDAATEVPLPGAKIKLYVREEELAVLQSDSEGKFEHKLESQYIGEILICKVEKAGYGPQEVIQECEEDEVTLAIKLVPQKDGKIKFTVNLKDEKRTPLKGVKVSLKVNGEGVGVGISDKDGIFKIALSPDFEGRTINYKAELAGFELASGAVRLKKETSVKITMKIPPVPPPDKKWLKIAVSAAGIAIVILAAIILLLIILPEKPEIKYFVASPGMIGPGDSSKLSWDVSDATHVNIEPAIGGVALTGSRVISPMETTTYTLTATNDAGTDVDTTTVKVLDVGVLPEKPEINYFKVSPREIKPDESATLSWSVSDATRVTIAPGIGSVKLTGTKVVFPNKDSTYTLTATNDVGSVDETVNVSVLSAETPVPDKLEINYFKASPGEIKIGASTILSWNVSGATIVTIDHGIGSVPISDVTRVYPSDNTTYTLTATNEAGSVDAEAQVVVVL